MKLDEAIKLITGIDGRPTQQWADLGCGDGLFTIALANLLGKDSIIHAVDTNQRALSSIADREKETLIKKYKLDFVKNEVPFADLDGILMANSIHFVKYKSNLISKLKTLLKPAHVLLIVEYDTDVSNPWVPYPISFKSLEKFLKENGYNSILKLHETPSLYNRTNIYSVVANS